MIKTVAVLGAGVMGHGIAQLYATAGFQVFLYDIKDEFLEKGIDSIKRNLTLLEQEGMISSQSIQETLNKITVTTDLQEAVQIADFITEAVPEVLELKWELFEKLERFTKPDCIIASNTSTFPISHLIKKSKTSQRMIITHFFNPAQLVPLVEVVKHEGTTESVVTTTMDLMRKIGKAPVLLKKEVPGFIANRLQAALVREAFHLFDEGVAEPQDIDLAITAGPGFRWSFIGPLETVEFGGLDTWKRVIDNLAPELAKNETAPQIINDLVQQNHLGTKTGKGIFSYSNEKALEKIADRDLNFINLLKIKKK